MALIFAVRGTQTKPYYSRGSQSFTTILNASGSAATSIVANADPSVFGNFVLRFNTTRTEPRWIAGDNWCETMAFALILRIVPQWTGLPAASYTLVKIGETAYAACYFRVSVTTAGKLSIEFYNQRAGAIVAFTTTTVYSFVSGQAIEFMFENDGTGAANSFRVYLNGVLDQSVTPAASAVPWDNKVSAYIALANATAAGQLYDLNELLIFNAPIGAYAARTGFYATPALNGDTMPAASDVRLGVTRGLITGTLDLPAVTDVRTGTIFDNTTKTGTCAVPSAANTRLGTAVDATTGLLNIPILADVRAGVTYDNATKTGTLDIPVVGDVRLGTVYDNLTKTGTLNPGTVEPTAAEIAAAVWDALLSSHATTGSFGKALQDIKTLTMAGL